MVVHPGGHPVLHGVDLAVPAGSLTTLTGPSGVGKSTLLRAIAGLEDVHRGAITLGGRDLGRQPTHARGIAFVFQRPRLFPHLSVVDNVAFPLRTRGVGERERIRRASGLLEEVELAGFERRSPRRLSGGEAQRVALARALAADPSLLLLDEPLASVDPDLRLAMRELLRRLLGDRPMTAIYVTHDQSEAAELGDRMAVMLRGRIAQEGPPQELFEHPSSLDVARFLGNPNVLSGQVVAGTLRIGGAALAVSGPDGPATYVIRPQHVRLTPPSRGRPAGRVIERQYLGTRDRVRLIVDDTPLEADVTPGTAPAVGSQTGLDLPADRLWRIAPDPARSLTTEGKAR